MSRVLVLGAGFDSLLAAHAASVLGHDVHIFASGVDDVFAKDFLAGAQFLLAPIPMVPAACAPMRFHIEGDPADVLAKLLNQAGTGRAPFGLLDGIYDGRMVWDARGTYKWLHETYGQHVQVLKDLRGSAVLDLITVEKPDFIISGMPAPVLCQNSIEHSFSIAGTASMRMLSADEPGYLLFSGHPDDAWAIESCLFGDQWRTYGAHNHPPISADRLLRREIPQLSNCDCADAIPNLALVGEMATWNSRWPRHRGFYRTFHELDGV